MFAVPNAKRIKRSHLFRNAGGWEDTPISSRSASPEEAESDAHEDVDVSYGFEYEFVAPKSVDLNATPATVALPLESVEEADEPEYQFRLFAPGPKPESHRVQRESATTNVKIRLSATPEPAELAESLSLDKAHFLRPNRPDDYYFTSALPEKTIKALRSQYKDTATSGSNVLLQAKSIKWAGTALPWRLIKVEVLNKTSKSKTPMSNKISQQKPSARARPSKKRRILLRRRLALRSELVAQSKIAEETEREKRTRRNREKKVKKKEREKRKKLDADGGDEADGAKAEMRPPEEDEPQARAAVAGPSEEEPRVTVTPSDVAETNANDADKQTRTESPSIGRARSPTAVPVVATAKTLQGPPPIRRAPTSRAPTAAKAAPSVATAKTKAKTSTAHPTKPRP